MIRLGLTITADEVSEIADHEEWLAVDAYRRALLLQEEANMLIGEAAAHRARFTAALNSLSELWCPMRPHENSP